MDFDFSGLGFRPGQFAVVTGAGNGIGRATSLMLARAGVTVGAWDIDEASLTAVGEELNSIGPAPHLQVGDLTQDRNSSIMHGARQQSLAKISDTS